VGICETRLFIAAGKEKTGRQKNAPSKGGAGKNGQIKRFNGAFSPVEPQRLYLRFLVLALKRLGIQPRLGKLYKIVKYLYKTL